MSSSTNDTLTYVLDTGADPVAEFGSLTKAPATGPVTTTPSDGWLTTDGNGNVTAVTDHSGAAECAARFDPYGSPERPTFTAPDPDPQGVCSTGMSTNQDWYQGARRDATTGTYQFGTRTYDPSKAAFTSTDNFRDGSPAATASLAADPLTADTYNYVNGDPLNGNDTDGHGCSYSPDDFPGDHAGYVAACQAQNNANAAATAQASVVIQPVAVTCIVDCATKLGAQLVADVATGEVNQLTANAQSACSHAPDASNPTMSCQYAVAALNNDGCASQTASFFGRFANGQSNDQDASDNLQQACSAGDPSFGHFLAAVTGISTITGFLAHPSAGGCLKAAAVVVSYAAGPVLRGVPGAADAGVAAIGGETTAAEAVKTGDVAVRTSTNTAGDVDYVGITNNLERRAAGHLSEKGISISPINGLENLSRADARAVEQVLIEENGGPGGEQLLNKINSIAERNPGYAGSINADALSSQPLATRRQACAADMARPQPGLTFSLPSDAGYIVGVVTHDMPKVGSLVWIATPTFDEEPTVEDVERISSWRWPVILPLQAAIRRHIVSPIGVVAIGHWLRDFPAMRSGNRKAGWTAFTEVGGVRRQLGPTDDPRLPIYQIVNDTRLKELVVSGWRPEDVW